MAYLPMAWIGQNLFSYAQWMVVGFRINCPESGETTLTDMREIGPTYYFAPPRVLEALLTQVTIRMEDASWVKRRMFHHFMELARRVGFDIEDPGFWSAGLDALSVLVDEAETLAGEIAGQS